MTTMSRNYKRFFNTILLYISLKIRLSKTKINIENFYKTFELGMSRLFSL